MDDEIYTYICLKNKPLPQSELIIDRPEWAGHAYLSLEGVNIAVLIGFTHPVMQALVNLWKQKKIALVDFADGQFAYVCSGKQPKRPVALDWTPKDELHWKPILIYSDVLMWQELRRRRLTWQNVLQYDKFTRKVQQ